MLYGVADVDPVARDTARSYASRRWRSARPLADGPALRRDRLPARRRRRPDPRDHRRARHRRPRPGRRSGSPRLRRGPDMYALVVVIGLLGVAVNWSPAPSSGACCAGTRPSAGTCRMRPRALHARCSRSPCPRLLVAWWFASAGQHDFFWPPLRDPADVPRDVDRRAPHEDVLPSLGRLLAGLRAGAVLGVAVGSHRPPPAAAGLLRAALEFFRAIPPPVSSRSSCCSPGHRPAMKIVVIAAGLRLAGPAQHRRGRARVDEVLPTPRAATASAAPPGWAVVLRAASPQIVAGARQALPSRHPDGISELFGANTGLGATIVQFPRSFAIPEMWTGIILLGLIGVALRGLPPRRAPHAGLVPRPRHADRGS